MTQRRNTVPSSSERLRLFFDPSSGCQRLSDSLGGRSEPKLLSRWRREADEATDTRELRATAPPKVRKSLA